MKIICKLEQWTQARDEENGQEKAEYGGAEFGRAMNVY